MKTYYGEKTTIEKWEKLHRIIEVTANSDAQALQKLTSTKQDNENIYQILTQIPNAKLPQLVWDFFSGFLTPSVCLLPDDPIPSMPRPFVSPLQA